MTPIVTHQFQVNLPDGSIDFISVDDLPHRLARMFVEAKYPNCQVIDLMPDLINELNSDL